jgi:hypothetical protein
MQLIGGFGLFATPFLLFIRFVPMIALSEVKACLPEADPHHDHSKEDPAPVAADPVPVREAPAGPIYGVLARFRKPGALVAAVRRLRDLGYRGLDTYSPFPIHEMDHVMGWSRSKVPLFGLAGGIFGLSFA